MNEAFEKIMERLEELKNHYHKCFLFDYNDGAEASLIEAMSIVRQVKEEYISTEHINCSADTSTNTSTNGWIACSDRLPEECVPVNVTWINRNPESYYAKIKDVPFSATAVYYNSKWYWYSSTCVDYLSEYGKNDFDLVDKDIDVVAWQPLPEPFKERD